jgi:protein-S-isoprenylcysteine O-methyltransferase Ste14
MRSLELKIPPAIVLIVAIAAVLLLARQFPFAAYALPGNRVIAIGVAIIGMLFALSGLFAFRRAGTTVDPTQPDKASQLVTSGVYRITRNPMYLGFTLILLASAIRQTSVLSLLPVPLFIAYMHRFQIVPEERWMHRNFGEEFARYAERVRRWI